MKKILATILALTAILSLSACGGKKGDDSSADSSKSLDLRTLSVDEIIEGAKAEGRVESVGMPDDWTHWDFSYKALLDQYGLEHADVDLSSAEEIAMFVAEKDDPTKDIGDVGYSFTTTALEEDCLQPYTVSSWDSIPDWAKDPDGFWACSYTGNTCLIYNTALTNGQAPTTWKELMESDIVVNMGNVVGGASSQANITACAIANGGGFDNVQPGIDYFKELAKQGRLDPSDGNKSLLKAGEVQCLGGRFDFNGATWSQEINAENIDGVHVVAVIPQDGAVMTGYAQIINKWAPHPYAAALTMEYLFSEQGMIDRAYGGARPTRTDITLPDDVPLLPDEQYQNVTTAESLEQLQTACDEVSRLWQEEVIPLMG